MNSIRSRLVVALLGGTGLLCLLAGGLAGLAMRRAMIAEFDYSLATKAHDFASLAEFDKDRYEFEFQEKRMPEFERKDRPEYFQVTHLDGRLIASSPSLQSYRLETPTVPSEAPQLYSVELPDGLPGRAAALVVVPIGSSDPILIVVARDTLRLHRMLSLLAAGFGTGTAALLLLLAAMVPRLVRRGLVPLERLAAQAEAIRADSLDERFPDTGLPSELLPIARELNLLLERIETAFQRERRLGAAMAHELHTPIAELRTMAEVALKWPDDNESSTSLAGQSRDIAIRMQSVVDALMSIARCEAGLYRAEMETFDLAALLAESRRQAEPVLKAKRVQAAWDVPNTLSAWSDRKLLAAILANVVGNASEYVPEGGTFACRAEGRDGQAVVVIENTQHGLEQSDLPRLFEPMWRKDKSRTGAAHSGLGLTVVARFAELLGIGIEADLPTTDRFRIVLRIPRAPEDRPPPAPRL